MKPSISHKTSISQSQKPPTALGNSRTASSQRQLVLMTCRSVFESTIRYMAGLISAYELSGKQHFFLIQKAQQLADRLSLAWSQVSRFESADCGQ